MNMKKTLNFLLQYTFVKSFLIASCITVFVFFFITFLKNITDPSDTVDLHSDNFPPIKTHYVLTTNDTMVGLVVRADKTCPYQAGVGAFVTGQITADGLAGDADHHRYHGVTAGCSFDTIIADQDLRSLVEQRADTQDKIHQTITQFPPAVMQDALSMANHR